MNIRNPENIVFTIFVVCLNQQAPLHLATLFREFYKKKVSMLFTGVKR